MFRKGFPVLLCMIAIALPPFVYWKSILREKPYPYLTPSQRHIQQGLDFLDVDINQPMDTESACEHFDAVLALSNSTHGERELALFLKGWSLWAKKPPDFTESRKVLEQFVQEYPGSRFEPHACFTLGLLYQHSQDQSDMKQAAKWYRKVIDLVPDAPLAEISRPILAGIYRTDLDDWLSAAKWYGEAARCNLTMFQQNERCTFQYLQGKCLMKLGRKEEAIDVFQDLLQSESGRRGEWTDRVIDNLEDLGISAQADRDDVITSSPVMTDYSYKPREPVTIKVAFWILGKQGMKDAIHEIVRRYEERSHNVKVQLIDLPYQGYHDWLQTQIIGNEIPDIVQIDNGTAIRYGVYQGRLVDMTPWLEKVNPYTGWIWSDMYFPQFPVEARDPIRRRNWVISWASEDSAFFYNKDAFRAAGIVKKDSEGNPLLDVYGKPEVREPETWGDLMEAYHLLKTAGYYGEVCNFYPDPAPLIWQRQFITKQIYKGFIPQLDVITPDDYPDPFEIASCVLDGSLDLRSPKPAEQWRLLYEKSEFWAPGSTAMDIREAFSSFASGRTATLYWVSTDMPDLEQMSGFEIGVFPFPSLRDTPYFDCEYAQTLSMRAFEFAVPKAVEFRNTREAAIDFLMFFTSPEAQQLLADKANTIPPIKGLHVSEKLEPFMRGIGRKGRASWMFDPYEIGIVKEPYWAEGRQNLIDQLNSLFGDIPNRDYYSRIVGGDDSAYAQWRELRFKAMMENLQNYYRWAYERVILEFPEDQRQEIQRAQHNWIASFRQKHAPPPESTKDKSASIDEVWRTVSDGWGVVSLCGKMTAKIPNAPLYSPPVLSIRKQRNLRRISAVGAALIFSMIILVMTWRGQTFRLISDAHYLKWFLPTVILLGVFGYFPAASSLYHAFFRWNGAEISEFIGFENFRRMLGDRVLCNSVILVLIFLVVNIIKLIPTLLVSVILFHLANKRLQYWFRVVFVLPLVVPGIVTMLIWKYFYRMDGGLLNSLLLKINLISAPVNWLGSENTVVPSLLLIGFPFVSTVGVLILLAGLQGIPRSVFEAAELDGFGPVRRFFAIEMPLIMGQVKLNIVLTTIGTIQEFALPLILTRGGPNNASMLPGLWMYLNAFSYGKMGYAAALGVAMFLVILVLTLAHLRYLKSPEAE